MINKPKGISGESLAKKFLVKNKYKILETNYTNKIGEIDIICFDKREKEYVFVEVKARNTLEFGYPCEAVDKNKQWKIKNTASLYLIENKLMDEKIRFDIIEILNGEINQIKYAF